MGDCRAGALCDAWGSATSPACSRGCGESGPTTTPRSTARPTTRSTSRSASPPTSGTACCDGLPGHRAARRATSGSPTCSPTSTRTTSSRSSASSTRAERHRRPFELQADCFAGTWGNSVYRQGLLEPGDVEEATNAALAVGDFDVGNAQHHGTPEERREALLLGFESGDPSVCSRYVAARRRRQPPRQTPAGARSARAARGPRTRRRAS